MPALFSGEPEQAAQKKQGCSFMEKRTKKLLLFRALFSAALRFEK
jgi:hypothetical protein